MHATYTIGNRYTHLETYSDQNIEAAIAIHVRGSDVVRPHARTRCDDLV